MALVGEVLGTTCLSSFTACVISYSFPSSPIGAGKSTLIAALLGEIKKVSGSVHVSGNIGYSLQQPWIRNGTLRDNITFGMPFDETRYNEAVRVSALEKDLEWLPGGSDALLGEKGTMTC